MSTNISFDTNDLQTSSIITAQIRHESLPEKDARVYQLAHNNRSAIPFVNYPSRNIRVSGMVINDTISGLDTALDTFRGYFRKKNANLDIDYGGSTRRYIATVNSISIDRPNNLAYARFDIDFVCTEPFGRSVNQVKLFANLLSDPSFETGISGYSASGHALAFDGSSDWVSVTDSAELDLTNWSLEAYFDYDAHPSGSGYLVAKGSSGSEAAGQNVNYAMYTNASGRVFLYFEEGDGTDHLYDTGYDLSTGTTYHLLGVYNYTNGAMRLYVDEALQAEDASFGQYTPESNAAPLSIGAGKRAGGSANNFAEITLHRARVFNVALTSSGASALYRGSSLPSGCVAEYLAEDGSGPTLTDTSGNSNDGTITTATWEDNRPTVSQSAAQAYDEGNSLLATFSSTPVDSGATYELTGLKVGREYTISAYFLQTSDTDYCGILAAGLAQSSIISDGGWNRVALQFTATATTQDIYLNNFTGENSFYVDAIQLEIGDSAADFSDATNLGADITTSTKTFEHTFIGTAPFMLPVFTIDIDSVTDGDNYIAIGNTETGQTVTITGETFAASDELVIDCEQKTVTVNGAEVDFEGAFPEFAPGVQQISYSDNFTARSVDIAVAYHPMYL